MLPIVKSAHVLMRAYARKRCRFAPKNAFIPRTGAGITPSNVPRTTTKAEKERKARTGTAIIFFKNKTRRRRYVKARYLNKKTPRERHIKKSVPVPRQKYEKTPKILCQNCVASLFLLIFLTFCVVRDHEAMGSNPVTPTKTAKFRRFCGFFMLFFSCDNRKNRKIVSKNCVRYRLP